MLLLNQKAEKKIEAWKQCAQFLAACGLCVLICDCVVVFRFCIVFFMLHFYNAFFKFRRNFYGKYNCIHTRLHDIYSHTRATKLIVGHNSTITAADTLSFSRATHCASLWVSSPRISPS